VVLSLLALVPLLSKGVGPIASSAGLTFQGSRLPRILHDAKHRNVALENRLDPAWQRAYSALRMEDRRPILAINRPGVPPLLSDAPPFSRSVALTFDDGPHPGFTEKLLAALRKEGIKATFFVVGSQVRLHPELIKAEDAEGHTVANHTFSHVTLPGLPNVEVRTEYRAANDLIESILGKRPRFCRPPGGDLDPDVIRDAQREGMTTTLWTNDPGDFKMMPKEQLLKCLTPRIGEPGILLLHDGIQSTIDIIPTLAQMVRQRGLHFVTVDQLLQENAKWAANPPRRTFRIHLSTKRAPSRQAYKMRPGRI